MMKQIPFVMTVVLILSMSSLSRAGVYVGTAFCSEVGDCAPLAPATAEEGEFVPPFAIAHPSGYDGSGGTLVLHVCVAIGDEAFAPAAGRAIATWNALVPTVGNCGGTGCRVWEEGPSAGGKADAESVILHELGHCAFGLQHPDRNWDAGDDGVWEPTSFTRSWDVLGPPDGIKSGPDFIRGTRDDVQQNNLGMIPESVHWFRILDNDPFAIDSTIIDTDTYSRSVVANLPVGHSWAANGNRKTGEQLEVPNTQAVMYGFETLGEERRTLTADDVNMVKMAMTGQDLQAGTADDYTVELALSCEDPIAILIDKTALENPLTALGECKSGVDYSFPQNHLLAKHFTVVAPPENSGILFLRLNELIDWDLGELVFTDDFESGDLSAWSLTQP